MKLNIGENIKHLRRERDITQEQLAEMLGVSYQSVSRWENNTCYPDMELLPTLAGIFGTTVDKLLGVNEKLEQEKVKEYQERFQLAISQGDVEECIRVSREGVAEYPNNYTLLNQLMYALFLAGDDDGNIPDWKKNMEKYDGEITALGERIMKYCPDQDIRLEATGRLAFNHCEMGRKEMGRAIYETLPSQKHCKEDQIWWALEEEEKLPFTRKSIGSSFHSLYAGLYRLTWGRLLPDEELIKVYDKMQAFLQLMYDGNETDNTWRKANLHCGMAKTYGRLGKYKELFEELELMVRYAQDFDNRPESGKYSTLLLGEVSWKRTDFDTSDSRPLCEIVRDKWLVSEDFDEVRETKEFQEILQKLS